MTDKPTETPEPERIIERVPRPSLSFECECGTVGTIFDPRAWIAYTQGQVIQVKCGSCGVVIRLVKQEQPLIHTLGPNRKQRRAAASAAKRKLIV